MIYQYFTHVVIAKRACEMEWCPLSIVNFIAEVGVLPEHLKRSLYIIISYVAEKLDGVLLLFGDVFRVLKERIYQSPLFQLYYLYLI